MVTQTTERPTGISRELLEIGRERRANVKTIQESKKLLGQMKIPTRFFVEEHREALRTALKAYELFCKLAEQYPC